MADDLSKIFVNLPPEQQEAMLNGPGLPPPPGIIPNFENPPNQTVIAHASLVLCIVACVIFICMAVYAKVVRQKTVRLEDGE